MGHGEIHGVPDADEGEGVVRKGAGLTCADRALILALLLLMMWAVANGLLQIAWVRELVRPWARMVL